MSAIQSRLNQAFQGREQEFQSRFVNRIGNSTEACLHDVNAALDRSMALRKAYMTVLNKRRLKKEEITTEQVHNTIVERAHHVVETNCRPAFVLGAVRQYRHAIIDNAGGASEERGNDAVGTNTQVLRRFVENTRALDGVRTERQGQLGIPTKQINIVDTTYWRRRMEFVQREVMKRAKLKRAEIRIRNARIVKGIGIVVTGVLLLAPWVLPAYLTNTAALKTMADTSPHIEPFLRWLTAHGNQLAFPFIGWIQCSAKRISTHEQFLLGLAKGSFDFLATVPDDSNFQIFLLNRFGSSSSLFGRINTRFGMTQMKRGAGVLQKVLLEWRSDEELLLAAENAAAADLAKQRKEVEALRERVRTGTAGLHVNNDPDDELRRTKQDRDLWTTVKRGVKYGWDYVLTEKAGPWVGVICAIVALAGMAAGAMAWYTPWALTALWEGGVFMWESIDPVQLVLLASAGQIYYRLYPSLARFAITNVLAKLPSTVHTLASNYPFMSSVVYGGLTATAFYAGQPYVGFGLMAAGGVMWSMRRNPHARRMFAYLDDLATRKLIWNTSIKMLLTQTMGTYSVTAAAMWMQENWTVDELRRTVMTMPSTMRIYATRIDQKMARLRDWWRGADPSATGETIDMDAVFSAMLHTLQPGTALYRADGKALLTIKEISATSVNYVLYGRPFDEENAGAPSDHGYDVGGDKPPVSKTLDQFLFDPKFLNELRRATVRTPRALEAFDVKTWQALRVRDYMVAMSGETFTDDVLAKFTAALALPNNDFRDLLETWTQNYIGLERNVQIATDNKGTSERNLKAFLGDHVVSNRVWYSDEFNLLQPTSNPTRDAQYVKTVQGLMRKYRPRTKDDTEQPWSEFLGIGDKAQIAGEAKLIEDRLAEHYAAMQAASDECNKSRSYKYNPWGVCPPALQSSALVIEALRDGIALNNRAVPLVEKGIRDIVRQAEANLAEAIEQLREYRASLADGIRNPAGLDEHLRRSGGNDYVPPTDDDTGNTTSGTSGTSSGQSGQTGFGPRPGAAQQERQRQRERTATPKAQMSQREQFRELNAIAQTVDMAIEQGNLMAESFGLGQEQDIELDVGLGLDMDTQMGGLAETLYPFHGRGGAAMRALPVPKTVEQLDSTPLQLELTQDTILKCLLGTNYSWSMVHDRANPADYTDCYFTALIPYVWRAVYAGAGFCSKLPKIGALCVMLWLAMNAIQELGPIAVASKMHEWKKEALKDKEANPETSREFALWNFAQALLAVVCTTTINVAGRTGCAALREPGEKTTARWPLRELTKVGAESRAEVARVVIELSNASSMWSMVSLSWQLCKALGSDASLMKTVLFGAPESSHMRLHMDQYEEELERIGDLPRGATGRIAWEAPPTDSAETDNGAEPPKPSKPVEMSFMDLTATYMSDFPVVMSRISAMGYRSLSQKIYERIWRKSDKDKDDGKKDDSGGTGDSGDTGGAGGAGGTTGGTGGPGGL